MDEQAFVDEIFSQPESQDSLLVYADWLEDQGESDRARLIRVEVEYENITRGHPRWSELHDEQDDLRKRCASALPVSRALRKKMTFSLARGLASAAVHHDASLTTADLQQLARIPMLKTLLGFEHLPPEQVAQLSLCPNIQSLALSGYRAQALTEEDWQAITGLSQIERLELTSQNVTDEDLRYLPAMPQLRVIDLPESKVTDSGVAHLKALTRLESLKVCEAPITDSGLENLSSLRRLRVLSLRYTRITDAGLPHLLSLKQLTHLDIGSTQVKGDPVPVLARLKKLRFLGLDFLPGVNDTNLQELAKRLPALRELDLRRTSVTRFRLARLLPKTKWKKVQLEASLAIYDTGEEREVEAFEEFCRELDVFVEVDYE